jgi:hypothetical protein
MTPMFREVILLSLIAFATAAFSPQALPQEILLATMMLAGGLAAMRRRRAQ